MTLLLPPFLPPILVSLAAGHFPEADEDILGLVLPKAWQDTAKQAIVLADEQADQAVAASAAAVGETGGAAVESMLAMAQSLRDLAELHVSLARQLKDAARDIEFEKLVVIFTLGILAVQLTLAVTLPGGALVALARWLTAKKAIQSVFLQLLARLAAKGLDIADFLNSKPLLAILVRGGGAGAFQGGAADWAAQAVQIGLDTRDVVDRDQLLVSTVTGGVGGIAGDVAARWSQPLAQGLGEMAESAVGPRAGWIVEHLGVPAAIGGAAGAVAGSVVGAAMVGNDFGDMDLFTALWQGAGGGIIGAAGYALRPPPGPLPGPFDQEFAVPGPSRPPGDEGASAHRPAASESDTGPAANGGDPESVPPQTVSEQDGRFSAQSPSHGVNASMPAQPPPSIEIGESSGAPAVSDDRSGKPPIGEVPDETRAIAADSSTTAGQGDRSREQAGPPAVDGGPKDPASVAQVPAGPNARPVESSGEPTATEEFDVQVPELPDSIRLPAAQTGTPEPDRSVTTAGESPTPQSSTARPDEVTDAHEAGPVGERGPVAPEAVPVPQDGVVPIGTVGTSNPSPRPTSAPARPNHGRNAESAAKTDTRDNTVAPIPPEKRGDPTPAVLAPQDRIRHRPPGASGTAQVTAPENTDSPPVPDRGTDDATSPGEMGDASGGDAVPAYPRDNDTAAPVDVSEVPHPAESTSVRDSAHGDLGKPREAPHSGPPPEFGDTTESVDAGFLVAQIETVRSDLAKQPIGRWALDVLDSRGVEIRLRPPLGGTDGESSPNRAFAYDMEAADVLYWGPDDGSDTPAGRANSVVHAAAMLQQFRVGGPVDRLSMARDDYARLMTAYTAEAYALVGEYSRAVAADIGVDETASRIETIYRAAYSEAFTAARAGFSNKSPVADEAVQAAAYRAGARAVRAEFDGIGALHPAVTLTDFYRAHWDRAHGIAARTPPVALSPHDASASPGPAEQWSFAGWYGREIEGLRSLRAAGQSIPVSAVERRYTTAYERVYRKAQWGWAVTEADATRAGREAIYRYLKKAGMNAVETTFDIARAHRDSTGMHWGRPRMEEWRSAPDRHGTASDQGPQPNAMNRDTATYRQQVPEGNRVVAVTPRYQEPEDRGRPGYEVRRYGGSDPVTVLEVRLHLAADPAMPVTEIPDVFERVQEAVRGAFNESPLRLPNGDRLLVDVLMEPHGVAHLSVSVGAQPNPAPGVWSVATPAAAVVDRFRRHLGVPEPGSIPGSALDEVGLRQLHADIESSVPPVQQGLSSTTVVGPGRLGALEHPVLQQRIEDALADGAGFEVWADPANHPYGQLINFIGPGRVSNCIACVIAGIDSFDGIPQHAYPRWHDDRVSGWEILGEARGIQRLLRTLDREWPKRNPRLDPVPVQAAELYREVASMGEGAVAVVGNTWLARDGYGKLVFDNRGNPGTSHNHVTLLVYPKDAAGPVWWDPQSGETSNRIPDEFVQNSAFISHIVLSPEERAALRDQAGNTSGAERAANGDSSADGSVPVESAPDAAVLDKTAGGDWDVDGAQPAGPGTGGSEPPGRRPDPDSAHHRVPTAAGTPSGDRAQGGLERTMGPGYRRIADSIEGLKALRSTLSPLLSADDRSDVRLELNAVRTSRGKVERFLDEAVNRYRSCGPDADRAAEIGVLRHALKELHWSAGDIQQIAELLPYVPQRYEARGSRRAEPEAGYIERLRTGAREKVERYDKPESPWGRTKSEAQRLLAESTLEHMRSIAGDEAEKGLYKFAAEHQVVSLEAKKLNASLCEARDDVARATLLRWSRIPPQNMMHLINGLVCGTRPRDSILDFIEKTQPPERFGSVAEIVRKSESATNAEFLQGISELSTTLTAEDVRVANAEYLRALSELHLQSGADTQNLREEGLRQLIDEVNAAPVSAGAERNVLSTEVTASADPDVRYVANTPESTPADEPQAAETATGTVRAAEADSAWSVDTGDLIDQYVGSVPPSFTGFWNRMVDLGDRYPNETTLKTIGFSGNGIPVEVLSVAGTSKDAENVVIIVDPHPMEQIGRATALALAEHVLANPELRADAAYHFLVSFDPDSALLNSRLPVMEGPVDLVAQHLRFHRGTEKDQPEWQFGIGKSTEARPESAAFMEFVESLERPPALLFSLHNCDAGGAFILLASERDRHADVEGLFAGRLAEFGDKYGIPIDEFASEAEGMVALGQGVSRFPPRGEPDSAPYASVHHIAVLGGMGAISEVPQWKTRPMTGSREEYAEVLTRHAEGLDRVLDRLPRDELEKSAFGRGGVFMRWSVGRRRNEMIEGEGPIYGAEYIHLAGLRSAGMLLRAIDELRVKYPDNQEYRTAFAELGENFVRWAREAEAELQPEWNSLRSTAGLQLGIVLRAAQAEILRSPRPGFA